MASQSQQRIRSMTADSRPEWYDTIGSLLRGVFLVGVLVLLLSRFGVLSYVAWYATRSAISAAKLLGVAGWSFYRSLSHGSLSGLRQSRQ